jgi:hypothetical protein
MGALAPVLVLMAAGVLAALLLPLVTGAARDRRVTRGPTELDTLLRRKATLYANMKDLEFEFRMGKLSEADYKRLHDDDRAEAARILQEIDTLEDRDDADAIIEREIAARESGKPARALGGGLASAPAAGATPAAVAGDARCAGCGATVRASDRFCAQCGRALASEATR